MKEIDNDNKLPYNYTNLVLLIGKTGWFNRADELARYKLNMVSQNLSSTIKDYALIIWAYSDANANLYDIIHYLYKHFKRSNE